MEKYIGNKSSMLPLLESFISASIPGATSISDPFSGTNNVSRYFRARGWHTAVSDSNRFSYVLAQAYLNTDSRSKFLNLEQQGVRPEIFRINRIRKDFERSIQKYGNLYLPGVSAEVAFDAQRSLANILANLQVIGENNQEPGVIYQYFTQWGNRSSYISQRGTKGVRNYFSRENGLFLDGVLQTLRYWLRGGLINRNETFLLLTSILEEVVITANVSGTFHDFNRKKLWPNAVQPFFLRLPIIDHINPTAEIANSDAISVSKYFSTHDVCYLDPPYNFRQYNAYYHFLNFIAAYPFLESVESYVEDLTFVRGQNPTDDFTSQFCSKDKFVDSLKNLIQNIPADSVLLSYYSGRNHWNHWSSVDKPTDQGLNELSKLFEDSGLFERCSIVPALDIRKNYQSRVGEKKEMVNEYLLHGVKKVKLKNEKPSLAPTIEANHKLGLADEFRHSKPTVSNNVDDTQLLTM